MSTSPMGRCYADGETIVRQGEPGDCMYVLQRGHAEVVQRKGDGEVCLGILGENDIFGEMTLFDREGRSATVRALGEVWVLTVDEKTFLRMVHEDPSCAFRILETLSRRLRASNVALREALGRRYAPRYTPRLSLFNNAPTRFQTLSRRLHLRRRIGDW